MTRSLQAIVRSLLVAVGSLVYLMLLVALFARLLA